MLSQLLKIGRHPVEESAQHPAGKQKGNVAQHMSIVGLSWSDTVWKFISVKYLLDIYACRRQQLPPLSAPRIPLPVTLREIV